MKRSLPLFLLLCLLLSVPARAAELTLDAPSALLMEKATGTVLYAKDEHTPREPASVTKVMTLLLTMEAVDSGALSYDDLVTGSTHASSMGGSQIWLKEGEQMRVEELIKAVCVVSGNDAAVALGEHLAGSEEAFVARMNERAQELGYHLSVTFFYASQDAAEQLHSLRTLKSVGIVLLATEMRSHDMELFAGIDLPIVLLDNYFPSVRYDSVGIDNRYGAWNAVRYLIECGHIQLGYLHSSVEIRNFAERYDGYLYGCRSLPEGVAKDSSRRIVRVGSSAETAAKDMRAYLATEPMLPSAFFADNDQIAAGCCRALLEEGIRIPQDISIIGFDDSSICTMMSPQLTTMGVHKKRMGGLAVSRLHERLQYHMPENVRTLIQPSIVVRGTVRNRNAPDPSR